MRSRGGFTGAHSVCIALCLVLSIGHLVAGAISEADLLRLVESGVDPSSIAKLVEKDCVDFEVDAAAVLRLSGVLPEAVLEAAIECQAAARSASNPESRDTDGMIVLRFMNQDEKDAGLAWMREDDPNCQNAWMLVYVQQQGEDDIATLRSLESDQEIMLCESDVRDPQSECAGRIPAEYSLLFGMGEPDGKRCLFRLGVEKMTLEAPSGSHILHARLLRQHDQPGRWWLWRNTLRKEEASGWLGKAIGVGGGKVCDRHPDELTGVTVRPGEITEVPITLRYDLDKSVCNYFDFDVEGGDGKNKKKKEKKE
jgi:hypothetical protein